jgi:hypothetical protein
LKKEISPLVAVVIIGVIVLGVGVFMWQKSAGKSFTKTEASGKLGSGFDPSKLPIKLPEKK